LPWIASLSKIETITEEDEEDGDVDAVAEVVGKLDLSSGTDDEEVMEWVKTVLERKKQGLDQNTAAKPALHTAPLDQMSPVSSPMLQPKPTTG
jgi:mitogen-activated protein kinase kinase